VRPTRLGVGSLVAGALFAAPYATAAGPPLVLERLTFVASHEATAEVRVEAASAVIDDARNRAELASVNAEWAGADGKPSLQITCERGELDLETNDLLASGSVRGVLADGRRFAGPWLRYDRARGVAFTQAPVKILEGGRVLRGGGFEYHVRDRRLRLTAGAKVEENPSP
jgi:LPS export ABC transporter protein LptC